MKKNAIPITETTELSVGDYVFWGADNEKQKHNFYGSWSTIFDPHPKYPNGYMITRVYNGTNGITYYCIQSHNANTSEHSRSELMRQFKKTVFTKQVFADKLEEEVYNLNNIGFREG